MKFKTKSERKEFIRSRSAILSLGAAAFLLSTSKQEIRASVHETLAPIAPEMNDEIRDEEQDTNSRLSFDSIREAKQKETDSLLSKEEKAQLARELAASRASRESFELKGVMEFA